MLVAAVAVAVVAVVAAVAAVAAAVTAVAAVAVAQGNTRDLFFWLLQKLMGSATYKSPEFVGVVTAEGVSPQRQNHLVLT